jgi:hypothetical protein
MVKYMVSKADLVTNVELYKKCKKNVTRKLFFSKWNLKIREKEKR